VVSNARATRLLFEGRRVIGVEYLRNDRIVLIVTEN
jgi:choline dehydrogenase-like flavoprotein